MRQQWLQLRKNSMYVRLAKIWRIWRTRNSRHGGGGGVGSGGGGGDAALLLPENVQFDPNLMSWVKLLLLLLFLSSIRLDYLFKVMYPKYYKKTQLNLAKFGCWTTNFKCCLPLAVTTHFCLTRVFKRSLVGTDRSAIWRYFVSMR